MHGFIAYRRYGPFSQARKAVLVSLFNSVAELLIKFYSFPSLDKEAQKMSSVDPVEATLAKNKEDEKLCEVRLPHSRCVCDLSGQCLEFCV